jgi:hypothetical protein
MARGGEPLGQLARLREHGSELVLDHTERG